MQNICAHTLSTSLINQLNLQNKSLEQLLSNTVLSFDIKNYENIKTMSLSIKNLLRENNIDCQHSKIINMIAKSLGFQNQHSLAKDMAVNSDKNKKLIDSIDIKNDSTLVKLFKIKELMLNRYSINKWDISVFANKNIEFSFIYPRHDLPYKKKIELNKFLRAYEIKPYKNTISIIKLKYKELEDIAFKLISHYKSFFESSWYEGKESYRSSANLWPMISYRDIKIYEDLIFVDNYTTDTHWNIINRFLDYAYSFGTLDDLKIFEQIIEGKYTKSNKHKLSLVKNLTLKNWNEHYLRKDISYYMRDNISDTLDNIKYNLPVQASIILPLEQIENKMGLSIKEILIDYCAAYYSLDFDFLKLVDVISMEFYNKEFAVFDIKIRNVTNVDELAKYQVQKESVVFTAKEVLKLISIYKDKKFKK